MIEIKRAGVGQEGPADATAAPIKKDSALLSKLLTEDLTEANGWIKK